MVRLARIAVAVAFCWAIAAAWAPPASAVSALTVSPNADLVDGQVVTLQGSGFAPNIQVGYCQAVADVTPAADDCGGGIGFVTTSATGAFTAELTVRRHIFQHTRDCAVDPCVIGAADPNDIAGTVATADVSFDPDVLVPQPDARVRNQGTGEIYGDDVYSSDGLLTTRIHAIRPGGVSVFAVQVENEGPTDSFRITADPSASPFTVRYLSGYYDITSAVTGAGATLRNLAPNQVRGIAVEIRAAAGTPPLSSYGTTVTFTSLTSGNVDQVTLGVRVPRST